MNPGTAATLRLTPPELFPTAAGASAAMVTRADTAPASFTPALVRNVQASLRALGLYAGFIDGVWGPATQSALVRFQTNRGLPPDGQVTPATLQALNLDPANPTALPR